MSLAGDFTEKFATKQQLKYDHGGHRQAVGGVPSVSDECGVCSGCESCSQGVCQVVEMNKQKVRILNQPLSLVGLLLWKILEQSDKNKSVSFILFAILASRESSKTQDLELRNNVYPRDVFMILYMIGSSNQTAFK